MVFGVLVLRPWLNRIVNIALATVYGVSIIAAAIGEWTYYVLGSLIEVALLVAVIFYAWTWPKELASQTTDPFGFDL
jgi:membrane protein DedA with SNARE-associated domain